jgi:hypothetical protein
MSTVLEFQQVQAPQLSEEQGLSLLGQAKTLIIKDQQTYDCMVEVFDAACQMEAQIKADFEKPKSDAHKAHKAICDLEKKYLKPVSEAKDITSRAIGAWDAEQKAKEEAERKRLEAEARQRAEAEIEHAALEAIDMGADEDEVDAIINTPAIVSRVSVAPSFSRSKATSERWHAEPKGSAYSSLLALVKAAAENPAAYLGCLSAHMPEINRRAQKQKQEFNVPGFTAKPENKAVNRSAGRK